jgi:hypothetical protein
MRILILFLAVILAGTAFAQDTTEGYVHRYTNYYICGDTAGLVGIDPEYCDEIIFRFIGASLPDSLTEDTEFDIGEDYEHIYLVAEDFNRDGKRDSLFMPVDYSRRDKIWLRDGNGKLYDFEFDGDVAYFDDAFLSYQEIPAEWLKGRNQGFIDAVQGAFQRGSQVRSPDPSLSFLLYAIAKRQFSSELKRGIYWMKYAINDTWFPDSEMVRRDQAYITRVDREFLTAYHLGKYKNGRIHVKTEMYVEMKSNDSTYVVVPVPDEVYSPAGWFHYAAWCHFICIPQPEPRRPVLERPLLLPDGKTRVMSTYHGVYLQKDSMFKWLFITADGFSGQPSKMRFKSIEEIHLLNDLIIIHQSCFNNNESVYVIDYNRNKGGQLYSISDDNYLSIKISENMQSLTITASDKENSSQADTKTYSYGDLKEGLK